MTLLRFRDVALRRGVVTALDGLSFEVARGERVALVGPSGCGKTTALRLAAGLDAPDAGAVEWPDGRPRAGIVFQDPTLLPWASAFDNVRLPLRLAG
ncbi:MAG: ATP-binding cassette domain-containing protein, partial [Hyphomicrobiales bacterium]|nr:ATP-binding cassette domain-containing protein [Hyphomicrobiales bacterium]